MTPTLPSEPQKEEGIGTAQQLQILRHALGLRENGSGRSYRDHFVTGPGSTDYEACEALVASGHMTKRKGSQLTGGEPLYLVTDTGRHAAKAGSTQ